MVANGQNDGYLRIPEIEFPDRGTYTCTASNLMGEVKTTLTIVVHGKVLHYLLYILSKFYLRTTIALFPQNLLLTYITGSAPRNKKLKRTLHHYSQSNMLHIPCSTACWFGDLTTSYTSKTSASA